jgi:2-oxo-3-hexenedioate decarboxylase
MIDVNNQPSSRLCKIAELLDTAALRSTAVEQLSGTANELSLADAYEVQHLSVGLREARGERIVGFKMGFTSRVKMKQMGVNDLIWGPLTDAMALEDGGRLDLSRFIHPRAEPEIAFLLGADLGGHVSVEEARASVVSIAPALEIIDSRFANFRFSLEDVVADNCSSSAFVIGKWSAYEGDISNLAMTLLVDDTVVEQGSSAQILDDPINSLVNAARLAGERGMMLRAGQVCLAGSATAAVALLPGQHIRAQVERLGSVSFHVGSDEHG